MESALETVGSVQPARPQQQDQQQTGSGHQSGGHRQPAPAAGAPPPAAANDDAAMPTTTLIRRSCDMLGLPARVTCTALTFLHCAEQRLPEVPPERLAATCIFLGAKVEEASLRTNDLANAVAAHAAGAAAGDGAALERFPCLVGELYQQSKRQLILDEQLLLRCLRFELGVEQPHRHLYVLARCWGASREAVRVATCILNDAVCYCPGYGSTSMQPALVAAAALHLGAQLCGQAVQPAGWWRSMGISDGAISGACNTLLDLVIAPQPPVQDKPS